MSAATPTSFRSLPPSLAEAVARLDIRVRRPVQGRGEGPHRSPDFGASVEFAEYRDYTPGDPPARIDWAVYARSDRYRVRRFQEETSLRATILLDTSASMEFSGAGLLGKWDYACQLAAGASYALVRQGDSIEMFATTPTPGPVAPVASHVAGLAPTLRWLDHTRPAGRSQLATAITAIAARGGPRSLVLIIADFFDETSALTRAFRRLYHEGHNIIALHVSDHAERHPAFDGPVELEDSETGQRMVVDCNEMRARYAAAFQTHVDTLRRACAASLGDYHLLDTREPPEVALRRMAAGGGV